MVDAYVAPDLAKQSDRPLKIDIVVHGRFHGFALAKALIALGHDVVVLTNYPKQIVKRFGVEPSRVRSFLGHGLATRSIQKIHSAFADRVAEPVLHRAFGKWAARNVRADAHFIYGFSGVMEECLRMPKANSHQIRSIVRGSAHIREQSKILEAEEARAGLPIDRPSRWMIEREEREYALADVVFVLSNFARESFVNWGGVTKRLEVNSLGVDTLRFSCSAEDIEARKKRVLSGKPLRVLCVGRFSFQKGVIDLLKVARELSGRMIFRFVGDVSEETKALYHSLAGEIEMIDRVSESDLVRYYREADLFIFPTLHDGFAAVLAQARAAGLPILATTNCSASDLLEEGKSGWIMPIRAPEAFIDRLDWCDTNREELAKMIKSMQLLESVKTWDKMAFDLMALVKIIQKDFV